MMLHVLATLLTCVPAVFGARAEEKVEEAPPKPELRVLATTFNAGNNIYEEGGSTYTHLLEALAGGHNEDGEEADVVFLGLQEFKDDGYGFGVFAQNSALWKTMTESKAHFLKSWSDELHVLLKAPQGVVDAKNLLAADLQTFHNTLYQQVTMFERMFGENAATIQQHIADASPVQTLIVATENEARNYSAGVQRHLDSWHNASTSSVRQFGNLSAAAADLAAAARNFPNSVDITKRLAPIHEWRDQALARLQKFWRRNFPNLINEEVGADAWAAFTGSLGAVQAIEADLIKVSQSKPTELREMITDLEQTVKMAVKEKEKEMATVVQHDFEKIKEDVEKLLLDVEGSSAILKQETTSGYRTAAQEWNKDKVLSFLRKWSADTSSSVDQLLQPTPLHLNQSHFKAKMHVQKWASGWMCEAASHYDTILYAFVNPWSKWKISPVEHASEACMRRTSGSRENPGCNIDNSNGMDCGKVVNLMVFGATHEEHSQVTIRICALNTHMSFAGTAEQRMSYIVRAIEETEQAKCDAVVFVGDFNSRLHCQDYDSKLQNDVPVFALEEPGISSLDYVLDQSCKQDKCTLRGSPNLRADELTQMLDSDKVTCFEAVKEGLWKKKLKGWSRHILLNTLRREGLSEVNVPDFAPTYKLAHRFKVQKQSGKAGRSGWSRCFANETLCFYNPSKGPKHNPAWADRILVRNTPRASIKTLEYSRQQIRTEFESDHLPVMANLLVSPRS